MVTTWTAIDELIQMAEQKEERKDLEFAAQQLSAQEQEQMHANDNAWKVNELLGEAWEELDPYRTMTFNGQCISFVVHAQELGLAHFVLKSSGDHTFIWSDRTGDREISNRDEFAYYLMRFRQEYKRWKKDQEETQQLKALENQFIEKLDAWLKKQEEIRAENRRRLTEAQSKVKPITVHNLRYSIIAHEHEQAVVGIHHAPVFKLFPDNDGFWDVVKNGTIERVKYYFPIAISADPVILHPTVRLFFPEVWGVRQTLFGSIFFGPNDVVDELIPEFLPLEPMPEPPADLPESNVQDLRWKYERLDSQESPE
jgi:hypothetical protein